MQPSSVPRQRVGEKDVQGRSGTTGQAGTTSGAGGVSGTPTGGTTDRPFAAGTTGGTREGLTEETDIEMIRSEERLRVGTESREKGRVHLH